MKRPLLVVLAWVLGLSPAGAYYHFLHYTTKTAPYNSVPEKFDLSALPNKTITFFVSTTGPKEFAQHDGFPSLLSQVRQATRSWDSVPTSDLRVAFGGLHDDGNVEKTPSVKILFDDEIPPGLLAYTVPTSANDMVTRPEGRFFPITQSIVHFHTDLTQRPGPSYTDSFFLTVVHEMGHALGLQHTFTSSVMSTSVTRSTSALHPLDADDIAAISLLYPRNFGAGTGVITGTVTAGDHGVHMASVVALRPNAPAVSALTNPDGTYRIEGLPPGSYFVYAHPLPPTANIILPLDPDGNPVDAGGPFDAEFYPGTNRVSDATAVVVHAASTSDKIDFSVNPAASTSIYDVSLYSYFGQNGVHPAYVNMVPGGTTIAAAGNGLGANGQAAAGLGVSVIGSAFIPAGGVRGYGTAPTYLAIDLKLGLAASTGPQHFIFSQGTGMYVLPAGVNLVQSDPPAIDSVTQDGDGNAVVTGSNFSQNSQVYFAGLPAATKVLDSSHAVAVPPPGSSNQQAVVTMFNSDGQNSLFFGPSQPPTFNYGSSATQRLTFSPNVLPAGARAMVDVTGVNTHFVDGMTIGFGTTDVFVSRVWVLSPNHALLNVSVAPAAQPGASLTSVISGFQIFSQPGGFHTIPGDRDLPIVEPTIINGIWLPSGVYPGSIASLFGLNLGGPSTRITINDQPVTLLYSSPVQINLVIPASLHPGPAILRLNNGARDAFPVVISIDATPPVVTAIISASTAVSAGAKGIQPGDQLNLTVTGLADPGSAVDPHRVHAVVGGIDIPAAVVSAAGNGGFQVQITLPAAVTTGQRVPVTVSIDGRTSLPFYISITPLPTTSSGT